MNIGIVGLGLIGGSLARQFKRNTPHSVYGYDISADATAKAELLGAIDGVFDPEDPGDLDVVFIALTPIAANRVMDVLAPKLKKGAIIADTAGVKRPIIRHMTMLSERYPDVSFVGVHPMAGREYSGISHSTATLFERAFIIITPLLTDIEAAEKIKELFGKRTRQDHRLHFATCPRRQLRIHSKPHGKGILGFFGRQFPRYDQGSQT